MGIRNSLSPALQEEDSNARAFWNGILPQLTNVLPFLGAWVLNKPPNFADFISDCDSYKAGASLSGASSNISLTILLQVKNEWFLPIFLNLERNLHDNENRKGVDLELMQIA